MLACSGINFHERNILVETSYLAIEVLHINQNTFMHERVIKPVNINVVISSLEILFCNIRILAVRHSWSGNSGGRRNGICHLHGPTSKINHTYRFRVVSSQLIQQVIQSNLQAPHAMQKEVRHNEMLVFVSDKNSCYMHKFMGWSVV